MAMQFRGHTLWARRRGKDVILLCLFLAMVWSPIGVSIWRSGQEEFRPYIRHPPSMPFGDQSQHRAVKLSLQETHDFSGIDSISTF